MRGGHASAQCWQCGNPCVALMIRCRADLRAYLAADLAQAKRHNGINRWIPILSAKRYPVLAWQRHLRRTEHRENVHGWWTPLLPLFVYRFVRHSIWLGFDIPRNVFGPGLSIAHWGSIIVNKNARIGPCARVHPGTVIGESNGQSPTIGEDVYLAPGSKIYGGITLGNRVICGANCVVGRSFGDDVTLVGVPAKKI